MRPKTNIAHYIRALRLPFISASLLPFVFGSFIVRDSFKLLDFSLGLIAVIATHLGANLINDYSDSRSGADWQDKKFYQFFGGSKLIQERVFSEKFYLKSAIVSFVVAILAIVFLAIKIASFKVVLFYLIILFLGFSYSHKPLQLSYHRLGELVIFILFGPAVVMGGYFIQSGIFPDLKGFLFSLPFGFFTTAILFANEVPDYDADYKVSKLTLVSLSGPKRAFIVYYFLTGLGFFSIALNIFFGQLSWLAGLTFILIIPAKMAADTLRQHPKDKQKLIFSSKMSIFIQNITGLILIISLWL